MSSDSIENIEFIESEDNLTLTSKNNYFDCSMYLINSWDATYYVKFIKSTEALIRRSADYSSYISYLKSECKLNRCAILGDINDEMAEIEFHHYPFTLYDICNIVTLKRLVKKQKVSTFLVAQEVIELHYNNLIGVVPLSITVHKLVHKGLIFINLKQVFGNVFSFIQNYMDYMSKEIIDDYNKLVLLSKNNTVYSEDDILALSKTLWSKNNIIEEDK